MAKKSTKTQVEKPESGLKTVKARALTAFMHASFKSPAKGGQILDLPEDTASKLMGAGLVDILDEGQV